MSHSNTVWAIVLAAGEGRRLRGLTTTRNGLAIPKQFCSLEQGPSLLQDAIGRAAGIADRRRICAVVAARHQCWWSGQLSGMPPENIIVQPETRGTASGVLLPLLTILGRDPQARIVLLPSDHHVRDEWRLGQALRGAAAAPGPDRPELLLLGLEPRSADPQLGYIVPRRDPGRAHHGVQRFVEKPDPASAAALVEQGALWNAFIIAADGSALLRLFERRCPDILAALREVLESAAGAEQVNARLAGLYQLLPELDFSRAVLEGQEPYLRVLPVPECGWSDLGTPDRVAEALDGLHRQRSTRARRPEGGVLLSLAARHRQLHGNAARQ